MNGLITILLIYAASAFADGNDRKPLSSLIPICSAKDPKLNACLKASANKLVPFLVKGIKEYKMVPMDPLQIPQLAIGQDSGPVNLKLAFQDGVQVGLSRLTIDNVSADLKKGRFVLNTTHPLYSLTGKYKSQGKLLVIPLVGDGLVNMTLYDTKCDIVIVGHLKKRNNKEYFNMDSFNVYYTFGKAFVQFSNLFNGNEELGRTTNKFLNENAPHIFAEMKGTMEDVYSELYGSLIRKFFENVPYNRLFKDV